MNKHTSVSEAHRDVTDAETIVSGVPHDVSNTQPMVPDVRGDAANARTTASDIPRSKLKSRSGVDGRNQAVCNTRPLPGTEQLTLTTA